MLYDYHITFYAKFHTIIKYCISITLEDSMQKMHNWKKNNYTFYIYTFSHSYKLRRIKEFEIQ